MDFDSGAPSPSRPRRANSKFPLGQARAGTAAPPARAASFVRRANSGSTRLSNRSSTSRTRGRHTSTVPEANVRFGGGASYHRGSCRTSTLRTTKCTAAAGPALPRLPPPLLLPAPPHLLRRPSAPDAIPARTVWERVYCPWGKLENVIKKQQQNLLSDHTSASHPKREPKPYPLALTNSPREKCGLPEDLGRPAAR